MESRPPPRSDLDALLSKKRRLRDDLVGLLHIAAQIEHDLMVQYLYAAYSLGGEQAKRHPDFVRDCRDTMLAVAREEMGHLLTIQNVLLLLGGPVSLEREPWSVDHGPVPFKLERFSFSSLTKYLNGEAPIQFIRDRLARDKKDLANPSGIIGGIYKIIIEIVEDKDKVPDSVFDPASYPYQATWDELARGHGPRNAKPYALEADVSVEQQRGMVIVGAMTTRIQIVTALRDIAGQGEEPDVGNPFEELSHFSRFKRLFDRFESIRKEDQQWSPSRPVADNPWVGEYGYPPANVTKIPWGTAYHWAELFNLRYRMLLSLLTYLFRVPRDARSPGGVGRAEIISRLFGEMYNMKAVAGVLVRLPLEDGQDGGEMAGPPFQVPYTLVQPVSNADFWRMHLELLDKAGDLADFLLTDDYRGRAPAEGERYLRLMHEADLQARRWVEKVLAGEGSLP